MWVQLIPLATPSLRRALAILASTGHAFETMDRLQKWMLAEKIRLFYYRGRGFEIAFGFRPPREDSEWRIAGAGWLGAFSRSAMRDAMGALVGAARSINVTDFSASAIMMPASDPLQEKIDLAVTVAQTLPGVTVQVTDDGNMRRYRVRLAAETRANAG